MFSACLLRAPVFAFIANVFAFIFTGTRITAPLIRPTAEPPQSWAQWTVFSLERETSAPHIGHVILDCSPRTLWTLRCGDLERVVFGSAGNSLNSVLTANCLACDDKRLKYQFRLLSDCPATETWAVFRHKIWDSAFSGSFQDLHLTLQRPWVPESLFPGSSGQKDGRVSVGNSDAPPCCDCPFQNDLLLLTV